MIRLKFYIIAKEVHRYASIYYFVHQQQETYATWNWFGAHLQHKISTNEPSWNMRINDVFGSISSITYSIIKFNINNIIQNVVNSPFFSGSIYMYLSLYRAADDYCCIIAYHDIQVKYIKWWIVYYSYMIYKLY